MDKLSFAEPFFFLNIVGLNPLRTDRTSRILKTVSVTAFYVNFLTGILELLFNFEGLETITRGAIILLPEYQHFWKSLVLLLHQKQLAQLVESCDRLWSLNILGEDSQKSAVSVHKFVKKFYFVYKIFLIFSYVEFYLSWLLSDTDKPIFMCYGENQGFNIYVKSGVNVLQFASFFATANILIGFDGIFFYLIAHMLSELRLVKLAFASLKFSGSSEGFRHCMVHHSFILSFVKSSNDIFSMQLFNQHLSSLFAVCFGLFVMTKDGVPPDAEHISAYSAYVVSFVMQLFIYCYAGNAIITWSLEIPDEVFHTCWSQDENHHNRRDGVEKAIIILRGQKAASLELAGFGNMDLESFSIVMKNAYSVFTFVNTMYHPEDH